MSIGFNLTMGPTLTAFPASGGGGAEPPAVPAAVYRFNGDLTDAGPGGYDLTNASGTPANLTYAAGRIGQAASAGGFAGVVLRRAAQELLAGVMDEMTYTVSAWVFLSGSTGQMVEVTATNASNVSMVSVKAARVAGPLVRVSLVCAGVSKLTHDVAVDAWHHVALCVTAGTGVLYVDGAAVASGVECWTTPGGDVIDDTCKVEVRMDRTAGTVMVDDVGVVQGVALTADQVAALWAGGAGAAFPLGFDPPAAAFSGTPLTGDGPLEVTFTDESTNDPTAWLWQKDDGSGWVDFDGTPTAQNPVEEFAAGTWAVRLLATNAEGTTVEAKAAYVEAAFNPLSLNPALWLKADAGLYQTVGGVPATANGDPVGEWQDQSGNDRNATQATASKRPTLQLAVQNGLPVVRGDGVDDTLVLSDFLSGFTAGEMLMVVRTTNDPAVVANGLDQWGTAAVSEASYYPYPDGVIYDKFGSTARKIVGNPAPSLTQFHIYGRLSAANSWVARLDGVQIFSTGTNTVGWTTSPVIFGSNDDGSTINKLFSGDIGEILLFSSVLSDADREAVETYLNDRWGL